MFGSKKIKILIIGMPDLVLYCIKALKSARKNIVGVITSPPSNSTYEYMKTFLASEKLLHIENNKNFKDEKLLQQVRELNPDVAFVCSFNYLLPKELYEIPHLGTINFHPSLLPDYRGANPYFHVINNDEKITGITMHFMDETFDTGDIIKQVPLPILDNDTMGSLFNRMNVETAKLCLKTVQDIEKGITLPRTKQTLEGDFKTAPKIFADTDDVKINWNYSVIKIERFIRALNPFFGATSMINGEELKFWDVSYIHNEAASALPAGTVVDITDEAIFISAKDGFIRTNILGYSEHNYFSQVETIVDKIGIKKGDIFK